MVVLSLAIVLVVSLEVTKCQPRSPNQQSPFKLSMPTNVLQNPSSGPGVDLVALNWRRFELDHHHKQRYKPNNPHVIFRDDSLDVDADDERSLARSRLIEAQVAALPEQILNRLPEEVTRQLVESVSADASLLGLGNDATMAAEAEQQVDPDGASIERLTKSCLTVQASSLPADQLNVTFHLYTRRNPRQAFVMGPLVTREELLARSPFQPAKPIKWITHGFHTNLDKSLWMLEARDKILAHEDANVILTDWRRGATPALAFYPKAAANAHVVAKMIVKILRRLWQDIDLARVHLIGHSLGAHIMGFVGSAFTEEYLHKQQQVLAQQQQETLNGAASAGAVPHNQLIGRITACDPALPCFGASSSGPNSRSAVRSEAGGAHLGLGTGFVPAGMRGQSAGTSSGHGGEWRFRRQLRAPPGERNLNPQLQLIPSPADDWTPAMWTHLRPDSAILVEVMHSNPGVMGYAEPLGDYDFFPNGSERQPGCSGDAPPPAPLPARARRGLYEVRDDPEADGEAEQVSSNAGNETSHYLTRRQKVPGGGGGGSFVSSLVKSWQATGGARKTAAGLSKSLGQFIKPIRDFFQAYTCSHHRSVEYMVESLYYELRLGHEGRRVGGTQPELVCQMVGYRCQDYASFKQGFCFSCRNELECRTLGLSGSPAELAELAGDTADSPVIGGSGFAGRQVVMAPNKWQSRARGAPAPDHLLWDKFSSRLAQQRTKRVLPSMSQQYAQNYKKQTRNRYFFDTKPAPPHAISKTFCLNHYHLLVRYRWFRIRDSVQVARLSLQGSLNDLSTSSSSSSTQEFKFHKFSQSSYTMLVTSNEFLGNIETLLIYGDHLRPQLIDFIEVSYLSNLDPRVRQAGSARLCRAQTQLPGTPQYPQLAQWLGVEEESGGRGATPISIFSRCPQAGLVR